MSEYNEINNNIEEGFYILGVDSDYKRKNGKKLPWWIWTFIAVLFVVAIVWLILNSSFANKKLDGAKEYFDSASFVSKESGSSVVWYNNIDDSIPSCTVVSDTLIDSIHLDIYTPYNVVPELFVGKLDPSDSDIVFATLAADIRGDNGKIVGAFVLAGEPLSWGMSKQGYCAISDKGLTVGVADNSPLFEQAIEQEGSFFRHYPAVDKGKMVKNNPPNKSYRRALCELDGKISIVVCTDRVVMDSFSEALVKLGVHNAIFLVGGTADGWYRTADGMLLRLGNKVVKNNHNINYIVFRTL